MRWPNLTVYMAVLFGMQRLTDEGETRTLHVVSARNRYRPNLVRALERSGFRFDERQSRYVAPAEGAVLRALREQLPNLEFDEVEPADVMISVDERTQTLETEAEAAPESEADNESEKPERRERVIRKDDPNGVADLPEPGPDGPGADALHESAHADPLPVDDAQTPPGDDSQPGEPSPSSEVPEGQTLDSGEQPADGAGHDLPDAVGGDGERDGRGAAADADHGGDSRDGLPADGHALNTGEPPTDYVLTEAAEANLAAPYQPARRFADNVSALETLANLVNSRGELQRSASPEEAERLARYVGWGGLPKIVDDIRRIRTRNRRSNNESLAATVAHLDLDGEGDDDDYVRLVSLFETPVLDEKRWRAIEESTLNAHYTQPFVARAMWQALQRLGFDGGRVLEPGSGTGLFIATEPAALREEAPVHGVEVDPVSATLAQALYPTAYIENRGFEALRLANHAGQYEAAVGNVPYGKYRVADPEYDSKRMSVHNHFLTKALDFVQPGGVAAFLTSRFTLDAVSPRSRQHLAERAELIGAVRLPRGAFSSIANTEVTEDLLIFRRVDRPGLVGAPEAELPVWARQAVPLGDYQDNLVMVSPYFRDHPEQVLGEMHIEKGRFGKGEIVVKPAEGESLETLPERLEAAVDRLIPETPVFAPAGPRHHRPAESAPAEVELGQRLTVGDSRVSAYHPGSLIVGEDGTTPMVVERVDAEAGEVTAVPVPTGMKTRQGEVPASRQGDLVEMIGIRDAVVDTLNAQQSPGEDDSEPQSRLNRLYDAFVARCGPLNRPVNARHFAQDPQSNLLFGIEHYDAQTDQAEKSAIFSERVIEPAVMPDHAESAEDALGISLANTARVVPSLITRLLNRPESDFESLVEPGGDLHGQVFLNPETMDWESAAVYLSGNLAQKIDAARRARPTDSRFDANIEALTEALPPRVSAEDIPTRPGAPWIERETLVEYLARTLEVTHLLPNETVSPDRIRDAFELDYEPTNSKWRLVKGRDNPIYRSAIQANRAQDLGTEHKNFLELFKAKLNNYPVRVTYSWTEAGKRRTALDHNATLVAVERAERIEADFREWLWSDDARASYYEEKYNRDYNSFRRMQADGSHMTFPGLSPTISLYPHQKDAAWFAITNRSALFAHEVGTGKTFAQIATAMEMNRLGVAKRAFMVVKRATLNQFATSARQAYPTARIVTLDPNAINRMGRDRFFSQLAVQDYDLAIMSHETFAKIGLNDETLQRYTERRLADIHGAMQETAADQGEDDWTVKTLAAKIKSLRARIERMINRREALEAKGERPTVTIEQINPGAIFYDESQALKNLDTFSSTPGLASNTGSDRAGNALMMMRVLEEQNPGLVKVFSSGTPVSNSFAEVHTLFRFLDRPTLDHLADDAAEESIDRFAGQFIRTTQAVELGVEGYYKTRDRIRLEALPELIGAMRFMDTRFADDIGIKRPTVESTTITAKPTLAQTIMRFAIMDRADAIKGKQVSPEEDNFLKLAGDGRKAATDMRLIDPRVPDDPGSKINLAVAEIAKRYHRHHEEKGTQAVFLDQGTPKKNPEHQTTINLYEDIREKLAKRGVDPKTVAFIHEAESDRDREKLFEAVNAGTIRVIVGSTEKMGIGANMQDRMVAGHHIDPPANMRPADMEQRIGRFHRQGNRNETVENLVYTTESSFDLYIFQLMEAKRKVVSAVLRGDRSIRTIDEDDGLESYDDIMAATTGSPAIKEKIEVDAEVNRLSAQVSDHERQSVRLSREMRRLKDGIDNCQATIEQITHLRELAETAGAACPRDDQGFPNHWSVPVVAVTDAQGDEWVMLDPSSGSPLHNEEAMRALGLDQCGEAAIRREHRSMNASDLRDVMKTTRAAFAEGVINHFSAYRYGSVELRCEGTFLGAPAHIQFRPDTLRIANRASAINQRVSSTIRFEAEALDPAHMPISAGYPAAIERRVFDEDNRCGTYEGRMEDHRAELARLEARAAEGKAGADEIYEQLARAKSRQAEAAERAEQAIEDIREERKNLEYGSIDSYIHALAGHRRDFEANSVELDPLAADETDEDFDPLSAEETEVNPRVASQSPDFSP